MLFRSNHQWTKEQIEELRRLVGLKKLSSAQIADELGAKFKIRFTRNQVIGKTNRLKLHIMVVGRPPKKKVKADVKPTPVEQDPASNVIPIEAGYRTIEKRMNRFLNPNARRLTIYQIKSNQCRYIVGDPKTPDYRYCAADVLPTESYCDFCKPLLFYKRTTNGETK